MKTAFPRKSRALLCLFVTFFMTLAASAQWSSQTSGTTQHLRGVHFENASTGWAVGNNGVIRTTTNGGTTWTAQTPTIRWRFFR